MNHDLRNTAWRMGVRSGRVAVIGVVLAICSACAGDDVPEVSWNRAASYDGEYVDVCGPVAGVGTDGDHTFLNLGNDYPNRDRFTIVLWNYSEPVEKPGPEYVACARGEVTMYEGVPEVQVSDDDNWWFNNVLDELRE